MVNRDRALVRAAGCLVWRDGPHEPEIVVVSRPRYGDLSFPKGKLDPGESAIAAAVREVEEETGLRVRAGVRLRDDHYRMTSTGQDKVVSYWAATPRSGNLDDYRPNSEVDGVRWLPLSQARKALTYPRDVEMLSEFEMSPFRSSVLLVLRHTEARKRKTWRGKDDDRPLAAAGKRQAEALVPVLAAYGVTRVVSSAAKRCVDTVLPYVNAYDVKTRLVDGLTEEGYSKRATQAEAKKALKSRKTMLICTHRPVLPRLLGFLGVDEVKLEPGQMLVIHRHDGKVAAVETP